MVNILKSGVISSNNLLENDLYGIQGTISKQLNNNMTGNVIIYTDKNGTISRNVTIGAIPSSVIQSLAGQKMIASYEVCAPGDRYSVEIGKGSVWQYNRYGIHGCVDINGSTSYPFADNLNYSGYAKRVYMVWTVPTANTYGNLTFAVQNFDKPASTNDNIWFIKNFKLEVGSLTPYTSSDYTGTGDSLIFKEFLEI